MNSFKSFFVTFFVCIHSACAGEILFVNMNNSANEILAAQKAAKEKGDSLIVIPDEGKKYDHEVFKRLVNEKAFKSLIISGHSGGDVFEGGPSLENKVKIADILSALDHSKSSNLETLYLMGCYSANKSKIAFWKSALPKLKFIAGFEQEAPLSTKPASMRYLTDLMKKEQAIIRTKNGQDLKLLLSGIDVLKIVNASLYVSCQGEDYNYVSQEKPSKKFSKMDATDCAKKVHEFTTLFQAEIKKYKEAEAEPTLLSTKDSILRKAYSAANQAEYCLDLETTKVVPELDPSQLFRLLFNKGYNENFSRYYKTLITEAISDAELALHDFNKYRERATEEALKQSGEIQALLRDPELEALTSKEFSELKKEFAELAKNHPDLDDCAMWNRNCHFPGSLIRKYNAIWFTLRHQNFSLLKSELENFQKLSYPPTQAPPITEETITIMKKMVSSPSEVTRKDIVALEKTFREGFNLTPKLSQFRNRVGAAYDLSPIFPFSWHEYADGEIEPPGSTDAHFKNPKLKLVNEVLLSGEYFPDSDNE